MKFEVVWSDFAAEEVDAIYHYYNRNATNQVALNMIVGIVKSTDILKTSHFIGKIETLLVDRELEYRRIIYTVDTEKKLIKVSDVFDMR